MPHKKQITALLACLLAWNSVLGGATGLLMCLHPAGTVHIASAEEALDCCESHGANIDHACHDCNDVELNGIDLVASRDNEITDIEFFPVYECVTFLPDTIWQTVKPDCTNLSRAPPHSVHTCLLVADTIVLLI